MAQERRRHFQGLCTRRGSLSDSRLFASLHSAATSLSLSLYCPGYICIAFVATLMTKEGRCGTFRPPSRHPACRLYVAVTFNPRSFKTVIKTGRRRKSPFMCPDMAFGIEVYYLPQSCHAVTIVVVELNNHQKSQLSLQQQRKENGERINVPPGFSK